TEEVAPSSSTLPSTSSLTTAQTLVKGLVFPPSATGTAPGTESVPAERGEEDTLVGQPPPPTGPGAYPPSGGTSPAIGVGLPVAAGAPGHVGREASAPVAIPGAVSATATTGVPVGMGREPSAPVAIPGFPGVPIGMAREPSAPVAIPGFPGFPGVPV